MAAIAYMFVLRILYVSRVPPGSGIGVRLGRAWGLCSAPHATTCHPFSLGRGERRKRKAEQLLKERPVPNAVTHGGVSELVYRQQVLDSQLENEWWGILTQELASLIPVGL